MTASWPRAWPVAAGQAQFKSCAEDFRVTEIPAQQPRGSGEHLYLRIEKTGAATPAVAAMLARAFAVPATAVGYAGMKDKRAVTQQWFSVHTAADPDVTLDDGNVRVLEVTRHARKLRRGDLAGNRFRVHLRRVAGERWAQRLNDVARQGVPNYFGPQRFGSDNLARARSWLLERRRRRTSAFRAGLYLSVVRAFLFNEVLAARVREGTWSGLLPGDLIATGAPHPTGPLWGRGRSGATAAALAIEQAALAPHDALCNALEHAGPVQARRSLVLVPSDLCWRTDDGVLAVEFALPPGGYATSLLAEVFDLTVPEPVS